jgi:hypothetical protein
MNDPFVLQHNRWGTIHDFKNQRNGETSCGNGTGPATVKNGMTGNFSRRRLSKANAHPRAHPCKSCARS